PGTAMCYDSAAEQAAGVYWLLLERVSGAPLCDIGEINSCQKVASWVAAMHARFGRDLERLRAHVPLIEHSPAYYRRWMTRARAFLRTSLRSNLATMARIEWLAKRHRLAVERLSELPHTLLHGEYYPSNILIGSDERVCPIDWEL